MAKPHRVRARLRRLVARAAAEVDAGMRETAPLLAAHRSTVIAGSVGYMAFDIATPVTAAVAIYRVIQLGLPAVLGAPAFVLLRRTLRNADVFGSACRPAVEGMGARTHGLHPFGQRP